MEVTHESLEKLRPARGDLCDTGRGMGIPAVGKSSARRSERKRTRLSRHNAYQDLSDPKWDGARRDPILARQKQCRKRGELHGNWPGSARRAPALRSQKYHEYYGANADDADAVHADVLPDKPGVFCSLLTTSDTATEWPKKLDADKRALNDTGAARRSWVRGSNVTARLG
jgi:hypothetical protein